MAETGGGITKGLAIATSAIGILSVLTNIGINVLSADAKARKDDFDSAVTIANIYFTRVTSLPDMPARRCRELQLVGHAAVTMARMRVADVEAEFAQRAAEAARANAAAAEAAPGEAVPILALQPAARPATQRAAAEAALPEVAMLVYSDMRSRWTQDCAALIATGPDLGHSPAATASAPAAAPAPAPAPSVPAPVPPAAAPATRPAEAFTVYIHYLRESASAQARAADLQRRIGAQPPPRPFVAPGTEGVRQVPNADQIRIYRAADEPLARRLRDEFGLGQAQIVSIERSFANLPPRIMEVWLATR